VARVEIYASRLCVYCWIARWLLYKKGVAYEIKRVPLILGWKPPTRTYREMVARSGGERTIPQIFVDGEHLGDEEKLQELERRGELDRALKIGAAPE
jgi:glutaredoxin 3